MKYWFFVVIALSLLFPTQLSFAGDVNSSKTIQIGQDQDTVTYRITDADGIREVFFSYDDLRRDTLEPSQRFDCPVQADLQPIKKFVTDFNGDSHRLSHVAVIDCGGNIEDADFISTFTVGEIFLTERIPGGLETRPPEVEEAEEEPENPNNPEEIPDEHEEGTDDSNGAETEETPEPESNPEPEDTGEIRDPTPAEKRFFDELLEHLKEDKEKWPENGSIEEKVGSMTTPFEFERSCQGVEETTVSKAKITVTSKQIHFDGELARQMNPDSTTGPPEGMDIMQCGVRYEGENPNRVKVIKCQNMIMLDYDKLHPEDDSRTNEILNEALLYHEFLHGQLQIDTMQDNQEYLDEMCKSFPRTNHTVDMSHMDPDHGKIKPLEIQFVRNLADAEEDISVRDKSLSEDAADDCTFRIDVSTLTEKSSFTYFIVSATGAEELNISDAIVSGKLKIDENGRCVEGNITLLIDPPSEISIVSVDIKAESNIDMYVGILIAGIITVVATGLIVFRKRF